MGIHAQGAICRGAANSAGARHWFATRDLRRGLLGLSCPTARPSSRATPGANGTREEYARRLAAAIPKLEALARPERVIAPGGYRVYIAPDAVNEFVPFFSWNGLGERGMREGESSYIALRDGTEDACHRSST